VLLPAGLHRLRLVADRNGAYLFGNVSYIRVSDATIVPKRSRAPSRAILRRRR
jgi:hypothetical protein